MYLLKITRDYALKILRGKDVAPMGLVDLLKYFFYNDPIEFKYEKLEDGLTIARSSNFRHGSIITTGRNARELDANITDAILTAFEVPSSYAREAGVHRVDDKQEKYAIA